MASCTHPGCDTRPRAGYSICAKHRNPRVPREEYRLPVGTRTDSDIGYVNIKTENGWKAEHRYVMEQHIGRPLTRDEIVHHKNGDRKDNRLENLELWNRRGHPQGGRVEDLVAWARQILEQYDPTYTS